jgi:excisionase family DNA binding protein
MTVLEVVLGEKEVAETQRRARVLQGQVAEKSPRSKVEVDAATLGRFLRFVVAATPRTDKQPVRRTRAHRVVAMPSSQVKDEEVSPQEAAEMLRMSRPSVMRLIQQGHLHSRKVLSRNRLSRAEVLAFQKRNARQQQQALEDLSVLSQEYDF